jgi:hypothetical protein
VSKRTYITKMTRAYFDERDGLCCGNAAIRKGLHCLAVIQYARNWLAEHGKLHPAKAKRVERFASPPHPPSAGRIPRFFNEIGLKSYFRNYVSALILRWGNS